MTKKPTKLPDAEAYINRFTYNHFERELDKRNQPDIYNPVTISYREVLKRTEKGLLLIFDDGNEWWFPKKLVQLDEKKNTAQMPYSFALERQLLDFKIVEGIPKRK